MRKTKTSRKRVKLSKSIRIRKKGFSVKKITPIKLKSKKGISSFNPDKIFQNKKLIVQAILECFQDNDPDAIIEILDAYVRTINKSEFAEKSGISRSTLYDMLQGRKNPTLRVFTQCVHEMIS